MKCISRLYDKRYSSKHVQDSRLEDMFEQNFIKIDNELSKKGVPEEITYPISIKKEGVNIEIINGKIDKDRIDRLTYRNIGCDASGRLYRVVGRCWNKEETKVGIPDTRKTISDNDGTYKIVSFWREIAR